MTDPRRDPRLGQIAAWYANEWGGETGDHLATAQEVIAEADKVDSLRVWLSSPAARDAIARAIYEAAPEMVSNGWGGHDPAPWGEFPATRRAASVYRQADAVLAVLSDPPGGTGA